MGINHEVLIYVKSIRIIKSPAPRNRRYKGEISWMKIGIIFHNH